MSRSIKRIVLTGPTGVLGLAITRYMVQNLQRIVLIWSYKLRILRTLY